MLSVAYICLADSSLTQRNGCVNVGQSATRCSIEERIRHSTQRMRKGTCEPIANIPEAYCRTVCRRLLYWHRGNFDADAVLMSGTGRRTRLAAAKSR